MPKSINHILKLATAAFVVLLPSFFLNSFVNPYDFPKIILLVVYVLAVLILFAVELSSEGKFTFHVGRLDLPLFALVAVYILSAIIRTQNKMEAFIIPGVVTFMIGGFITYFFAKSTFKADKNQLGLALFFSGVLASLISIFAFTGVLSKIPQLPSFVKDTAFSPLGGKLPEIIFFASILPIATSFILREKEITKKIFYVLATVIIILAGVLSATSIMPGKAGAPVLADFPTSWSVAVDTLKISPVLGIGPSNYLTAFSKFLPLSYNSTTLWAVRFSSARSFVLTLLTETGLLGILAFAVVVFTMIKGKFKTLWDSPAFLSLIILIASFILFPANSVLIILFFLLAALNSDGTDLTLNLSATGVKNGSIFASKIPSLILSLLVLTGVVLIGFFGVKAVRAEGNYKKAIAAITANDGRTSYNALTLAIAQNPYSDRYHATLDQLSLALARGVAQKKEITDTDRNTVAQLIQQAIGEGKATVALNTLRSSNWELLARTYQSIIPFAKGADNFAIQTFTQAIALDPINPNLRIALGGVYYSLGRYDDAINTLTLAVSAKPDLANSHYNLAIALREKKEFDKAISEMNIVLTLVAKDSKDYTLAMAELENLEKNRAAKPAASGEDLNAPQPTETSNIKPPLTLPSDATPPAATQ